MTKPKLSCFGPIMRRQGSLKKTNNAGKNGRQQGKRKSKQEMNWLQEGSHRSMGAEQSQTMWRPDIVDITHSHLARTQSCSTTGNAHSQPNSVCLFVCFYHFVFLGLLKAIFFCNHILLDYGVFNYSAYKITSGLRYRTNTPSKHIAQLAGAFAEQWSSLCVGPGVLQREWGMLVYRMTVETV